MAEIPTVPRLQDRRPRIAGLVPKSAQAKLLGAVALVMVVIILFSSRTPPKPRTNNVMTGTLLGPNPTQIQDFRAQIEQEMRKLAAEEAELARTKRAMGSEEPARLSTTSNSSGLRPRSEGVVVERTKRGADSLFASNIALTYRERPVEASAAPARPVQLTGSAHPTTNAESEVGSAKYRLFEGTILETVLTNRLDASFSGPVDCMVTTSLYSRDSLKLLIPQGTRVLGEVRKVETFGEQRVAVIFHRLIMPDGFSVNLDQFKGLDQIGETGLRDQVNHHYLQVFGASLAIGAFAGLSEANTRYGLNSSASDAYRQGVGDSLSQSAMHVLDRYLNILPTFTVLEGYRIKVYLSQDLLLPAYEDHPAGKDF